MAFKRFKSSVWRLIELLPLRPRAWSVFVTALSLMTRKKLSVGYDEKLDLYVVTQAGQNFFVARRSRIRLFHRGIEGRVEFVQSSYDVPSDAIRPGDIVVDCGANIGEFSYAMEARGAVVAAFEPEPNEYRALKINLHHDSSIAVNLPLWSSSARVFLQHRNDSGDSSISEQRAPDAEISEVTSITLDDWVQANLSPDDVIALLKLEAEGGELEVLLGSTSSLHRVRYICADLGEASQTDNNAVASVTNFLLNWGFELVSFNQNRCMTVFRNPELAQRPRNKTPDV